MSGSLEDVIHEAMRETAFRAELRSNPEEALEQFDLIEEEHEAIVSRDETKIAELLGDHLRKGVPNSPPTSSTIVPEAG